MEPETVSIMVHSGRNLQGRRKGKHKFHVIFGIGQKRFRTEAIIDPSGCPKWNSESHITVDDRTAPLLFTIYEKDDIMGQVSVPLHSLPTSQPFFVMMPLQPHRKCPSPKGEITYRAWISKVRARVQPVMKGEAKVVSTFEKLKDSLLSHSLGLRKAISSSAIAGKRELTSEEPKREVDRPRQVEAVRPMKIRSVGNLNSNMNSSWMSEGLIESKRPEVASVDPSVGPTSGFTKLTITGRHLGQCKDDIVGVTVCGASCLSTVQWESSSRIYCTTKPWQECTGDIIVTTVSGGRGLCINKFCFVSDDKYNSEDDLLDTSEEEETFAPFKNFPERHKGRKGSIVSVSEPRSESLSDSLRSSVRKRSSDSQITAREEMLFAETQRLREENEILIREKNNLAQEAADAKAYIEELLAKVIAFCPELLAKTSNDLDYDNLSKKSPGRFTMEI